MYFYFNRVSSDPISNPIMTPKNSISWEDFLSRHDLIWNKLPEEWNAGGFTGNGELGAVCHIDPAKNLLRWHLGKVDLQDHRSHEGDKDGLPNRDALHSASWSCFHWTDPRLDLGYIEVLAVGKILHGTMRQDLWNAEITGHLVTDHGEIRWRSFTHAVEMIEVIEIWTTGNEAAAVVRWTPVSADAPRHQVKEYLSKHFGSTPLDGYVSNPGPVSGKIGDVQFSRQELLAGGDFASAWQEKKISQDHRLIYCSTHNAVPETGAEHSAVATVKNAVKIDFDQLVETHREWWHDYYPQSFVSIPDTRLESFYWIQIYRLGSATRADRSLIDNTGPWYKVNGWAYATWDMNVQLCYWPIYSGNRLELGKSLLRFNERVSDQYIESVPEAWRHDSAGNPGVSNQRKIGGEFAILGCLQWTMHNVWLHYRYSMDDELLRRDLLPLLRRSTHYYIHRISTDKNGVHHLPLALSPEYPVRAEDTTFDLSLFRWGLETLLFINERLELNDEAAPLWREIQENLTPYPIDQTGLMVGKDVPYAVSHRHHQHLMPFYPLSLMTWDQIENRELIEKSVRHWLSLPDELEGFSYAGAASMFAFMRKPEEVIEWLYKLLDSRIHPNTGYTEWEESLNATIETPLSVTVPIHEMLLQSWGERIVVFPAVTDQWQDVTFHQLRAEGAFLVSAERRNGKTRWIHITSEAGEPCLIECDLIHPRIEGLSENSMTPAGNGRWTIDLKRGESVTLFNEGEQTAPVIRPVAAQTDRLNSFGLKNNQLRSEQPAC